MKKITREFVSKALPVRKNDAYKNNLGHVLCIGGNENMGGAIILSAGAALHAGAGLVTVASAAHNLHALHARHPEAMFVDMYNKNELAVQIELADVVILGPGLGLHKQALEVFLNVLRAITEEKWLIIDGDALTHLKNEKITKLSKQTILTPHLGEWRALTGIQPPANDIEKNQNKKKQFQATVVLKKERTEVYYEKEIWQNTAGNPSMATGGMGDTLTGIVGSFLGQYKEKKNAILSAVYVHSAIADELAKDSYVTLPSEIIKHLSSFMKKL